MVPLVLGFFNFGLKHCIMISYLLVFGGALGNICRFGLVRNELSGGPIINYDLVVFSIPMLCMGSEIGVMLNRVFPASVLSFILILVCLQAWDRTYTRLGK